MQACFLSAASRLHRCRLTISIPCVSLPIGAVSPSLAHRLSLPSPPLPNFLVQIPRPFSLVFFCFACLKLCITKRKKKLNKTKQKQNSNARYLQAARRHKDMLENK
jgi:hypothetical protein